MDQQTLSQMLTAYYEGPYKAGDRCKSFLEVEDRNGKTLFVSVHYIAYIKRNDDGNGIIIDRNGDMTKTKVPFIELAMMFELATKRVPDKFKDEPPRRRR